MVKFFNKGKCNNNSVSVNVNDHCIPKNFFEIENNTYTYIVLENTCGYYDFEDYIILTKNEKDLKESFINIYTALETLPQLFHGDLHNNNVKVNKEKQVNLFDFDYSCIITDPKIISPDITNYKLSTDQSNLIFDNNTAITIDNDFFRLFDMFRLWLSSVKTIKKSFDSTSKDLKLFKMITTFCIWYNLITESVNENNGIDSIGWHEYFMNDYFYKTIYAIYKLKEVQQITNTNPVAKNVRSAISVNASDLICW